MNVIKFFESEGIEKIDAVFQWIIAKVKQAEANVSIIQVLFYLVFYFHFYSFCYFYLI